MKKLLPLLLAPLLSLASGVVQAEFAVVKQVNGETMSKVGQATYSYLLIDLTETALYINPSQPKPKNIMTPAYSKIVEIKYEVDVDAAKFVELTHEALEKGWPKETLALYQKDIDLFCSWYQDVVENDRYTLAWKQGHGLTLSLNDKALGTIKDQNAAYVILSVWLGQAVLDKKHLNRLLDQWQES